MSRWFLYLEYLDIATSGDVYLRGDTSDQLLDVGIDLFSQYLSISPDVDGIVGGKDGVNDAKDGAVAKPASMSGTKVVVFTVSVSGTRVVLSTAAKPASVSGTWVALSTAAKPASVSGTRVALSTAAKPASVSGTRVVLFAAAKPASVSGTRVVLFAAALQSTGIAISETSGTNVGGDGGDGEAHPGGGGCKTDCAYVGNLRGGLK